MRSDNLSVAGGQPEVKHLEFPWTRADQAEVRFWLEEERSKELVRLRRQLEAKGKILGSLAR